MTAVAAPALRAATLAAAVGQAALPTLMRPAFLDAEPPPDVMEPAAPTFAVWLPVFATSLAHGAVQVLRAARRDGAEPPGGWPLAGAFASTAAWAPLVATGRYWAAQGALVAIAGLGELSRRRVAAAAETGRLSASDRATALPASSMLAAWGAAATAVNLSAMLVAYAVVPEPRATALGAGAALAGGALAAAAATSTPGGARSASALVYSGTWVWALGGIAIAQRRRRRAVAVAALASAAVIATATVVAPRPRG
jgi:hypothetical protein